ncbi:MAG: helix-turn-helix domain-containing protein [Ekhidna sp.]
MEIELSILSSAVLFACILVVILLVTHPQGIVKRNRFLIVSFSFLTLHQFVVVLEQNAIITFSQMSWPSVFFILIYAPSFWFYMRDIKEKKTNFTFHYFLWIIPYSILAINELKELWNLPFYLTSLFIASLICYMILSVKEIITNDFLNSNLSKGWMKPFVIAYLAIGLIYIIEGIFIFMKINIWDSVYGAWANRYYYWTHLIACFLIVSKMIRDPSIFSKYKLIKTYSNQKEEITQSEVSLLTHLIISDEQYLSPDISRNTIAAQSGISVNRISEIVNGHFQTNFSDLINDLRIKRAAKLLATKQLSIKEITYSTGFNSKSAFNSAFKKRMHCTPSQYRKKNELVAAV